MREDRTVSGVFSTYAVGDYRPIVRASENGGLAGRSRVLPTVAVVVTASAMALAFASGFERPNGPPTASDPGGETSGKHGAIDTATATLPGMPVRSPVALRSLSGVESQPEPSLPDKGRSLRREDLPSIAALHAPAVDAPATNSATPRVGISAASAGVRAGSASPSAISSPNGCERGCSGTSPEQADGDGGLGVAGQAHVDHGLAAQLSSNVTPRQNPAIERPLSPSPTELVDEVRQESGLLADAQPTILLAPVGQLVVDMPASERSLAVHAGPTGGHRDAAVLKPQKAFQMASTAQMISHDAHIGTKAPPNPVRQASSSGPPAGASGIAREPGQVSRIGQRPSSTRLQEPVNAHYEQAPANVDRIAFDRPIEEVGEQLASSLTKVSVPVVLADKLGAAPVVVEDNELVSIKLADLISLFEDRLDRPLYVWMKGSKSASKYVTVETLAAAGIGAKYDPRSRQVVFSVTDE